VTDQAPNLLPIIFSVAAIGLIPFAMITMTAFLKIAVVLFLLRNALGTQQTPPNLVLYAITLVLALYVSAPVLTASYHAALQAGGTGTLSSFPTLVRMGTAAIEPERVFMLRFAKPHEIAFMMDAAQRLWPPGQAPVMSSHNILVLIPAFVISQLTSAFETGFLIYLPFIAIDLIISNILMAMGMVMVSPLVISIPFKLFVFVLVSGWSTLLHGLVLSYAPPT
jgi:type III secretion protein R